MKPPPDQKQRDDAIDERRLNVVVDAGAGTGKTTLLVARLASLVAPKSDADEPMDIGRIAAVTFTRKAAGELKLRVREALLLELGRPGVSDVRRARLNQALQGLDTAYLGTIHSFADRLLRLRPMEARLSPSFEICEDTTALESEAYDIVLQAAELGTLSGRLSGTVKRDVCDEAADTIVRSIRAGLAAEDKKFQFGGSPGLRALFSGFLATRDQAPARPRLARFDFDAFDRCAREFIANAKEANGHGAIARWLRASSKAFRKLQNTPAEGEDLFFESLSAVLECVHREPREPRKGNEDPSDTASWAAWKIWTKPPARGPTRAAPLRGDLLAPVWKHLAVRLVRTWPVVVAVYEQVKARHRQVDQIDLLVKLRDLLRDNPKVRKDFQALFDHIFVDEFQDTDPLQAEVLLFLCEQGAKASRWQDVELAPGKLTLVGDPKQSIYRFRRADIAMYDAVRSIVMGQPHVFARLETNFRSEPALIEFFNRRFDSLLGTGEAGKPLFDATTGRVLNEHLAAGRTGTGSACVRIVPLESRDRRRPAVRALEAHGLARYLRWLVEVDKPEILDPVLGARRTLEFGDIAILAAATTNLGLLFAEFDELGIPYASRGGKLFLQDPVHRQFLLGLRALADKDDGVAQAALLRPPFFAVDLADLAKERAVLNTPGLKLSPKGREAVERVTKAKELVADLRKRRAARGSGETARDLLELTAFGRAAALGPNGSQRVARLRELCLALEQVAAAASLDFDSATAVLRGWVDEPVKRDVPPPLGEAAIQVMTVHQAKGLEFPVVALWDSCADLGRQGSKGAWQVDRDGRGWALSIDKVEWEEPAGLGLAATEQAFEDAERLRQVYVAGTRARDLLIVPQNANGPGAGSLWGVFAEDSDPRLAVVHEPLVEGATPPVWARAAASSRTPKTSPTRLETDLARRWEKARDEAAARRFAPSSVTALAHVVDEEKPQPRRPSRFGPLFGDTVHHAIGLVLRRPETGIPDAVARCAREFGLARHLDEAEADVGRALDTLAGLGLRRPPGVDLQLEYPVAQAIDGKLVVGYLDLLAVQAGTVVVIDFKTDAPPPAAGGLPEAYVAQLEGYGEMLHRSGLLDRRALKTGLLYTADGGIRWTA